MADPMKTPELHYPAIKFLKIYRSCLGKYGVRGETGAVW